MQIILLADRSNLAVAKKPGQANRAKLLLDMLRIVVVFAKKTVPAPIATAHTSAIDRALVDLFSELAEQRRHILRARSSIAPLKLDRLPRTWIGAHRQRPR